MLKIYILIALTLVINSVLKKFIRQKYNIYYGIVFPQRSFRYVNNTIKWVEISVFVLGVILFVLFLFFKNLILLYLLIAIFSVERILRAFFEYKYERDEKEYIITLVDFGIWSVFYAILLVTYVNSIN